MTALVHVIAESLADKFAGRRERVRFGTDLPQQFINRLGGDFREKLTFGIRPRIQFPVCSSNGRGAINAIRQ